MSIESQATEALKVVAGSLAAMEKQFRSRSIKARKTSQTAWKRGNHIKHGKFSSVARVWAMAATSVHQVRIATLLTR